MSRPKDCNCKLPWAKNGDETWTEWLQWSNRKSTCKTNGRESRIKLNALPKRRKTTTRRDPKIRHKAMDLDWLAWYLQALWRLSIGCLGKILLQSSFSRNTGRKNPCLFEETIVMHTMGAFQRSNSYRCCTYSHLTTTIHSTHKTCTRSQHFPKSKHAHVHIHPCIYASTHISQVVDENRLEYNAHMNVCKCVKGAKKVLDCSSFDGGYATSTRLIELFNMRHTVQFFQPQRYSDPLWALSSKLEQVFGSLCGASSYLTPAASQGAHIVSIVHECLDISYLLLLLATCTSNYWIRACSSPR